MPAVDIPRLRCEDCRRMVHGEDCGDDSGPGGSNMLCLRCQERLENTAAVIAARIERRHGVVLSSHAAFCLAYGDAVARR